MSSKEALNFILNVLSDNNYYMNILSNHFEVIQKDIEVLEILKKHFKHNEEDVYLIERTFWKANENYGEGWEKHNEEYNKIKEWLKNE